MPERQEEPYEVAVKIIHITEKALLVTDDDIQKVWLPKSQIDYDGNIGDTVNILMPEWLAIEKELA